MAIRQDLLVKVDLYSKVYDGLYSKLSGRFMMDDRTHHVYRWVLHFNPQITLLHFLSGVMDMLHGPEDKL